ncbi:HIT domain-containing protein [Desulfuromonas thiophila]|uniref:HIT domain-containing protein n=1 Tax=Desulfuromonas thiophila TaxID=57664 RepID=UPI0024A85768|nr:HIT family protein [Desulfuromonas thiophila]
MLTGHPPFVLDPQLAADCHVLGSTPHSEVLLLDNALLPWLILVPRCRHSEIIDLPGELQRAVLDEIALLSRFVRQHFACDKLNTATIGNIVRQLHIHIVGRRTDDCCWPQVVWGQQQRQPYTLDRVIQLRDRLAGEPGLQLHRNSELRDKALQNSCANS